MPNGNSPQIQIPLMAEGDTLKYLLNNDGFNAMDNAMNRIASVDMTAGNVALTEGQFTRNIAFRCSGHTATRTLTVPATVGSAPVVTVNRFFIVDNTGTGDITITHGAGVTEDVGAGSAALVLGDGTDIRILSRFIPAREYREEGVNQVTDPTFVNFVGNTVTLTQDAGGALVTITGVKIQDEGADEVTDSTNINFTGGGVSVTPTGSSAEVIIPGTNIEDEGVNVVTAAAALNFIGNRATVVNNAGTADVTLENPTVDVDGVPTVTDVSTFDILGDAVSVTQPVAGTARLEFNVAPERGFKGSNVSLSADVVSPTQSAWTPIDWTSNTYDYGGFSDIGGANPSRLTIPAGVTRARVQTMVHMTSVDSASDFQVLRIRKNATTELMRVWANANFNGDNACTAQIDLGVIPVTPGDFFEVEHFVLEALDIDTQSFFTVEAVSASIDSVTTQGRNLGFAGWTPPGNIFTALNSGVPDTNAYDAGTDTWEIETTGAQGLGFAAVPIGGIGGGADFDVVFALRGRLPNDADAEIGVYYGNVGDQDRTVFLLDEAGQFRKDFYNTNTTFGSTDATNAVSRVYNDFPRHGTFYMRLVNVAGVTSMQYSSDGLDWTVVFTGIDTENTMTDIDECGLFFNSANVLAGEKVKLRCVGYDVTGPQTEIVTGLNAYFPIQETTTARVAPASDFYGNRIVYFTNAAASTYTVNTGLTGTEPVTIVQDAAGQITITAGAGVTLKGSNGLKTRTQYSHVVVTPDKFNAGHFYVSGDTSP